MSEKKKEEEEVDTALLLFGRVLYISSAELGPALKLDSSSRVRAIEVIGPCAQCGLVEDKVLTSELCSSFLLVIYKLLTLTKCVWQCR